MQKKFSFPIQIFLFLEKLNFNLFCSYTSNLLSFFIFFSSKFLYLISIIIQKELFLNNSILIDNSAIDLKYFNKFNKKILNFFKEKNIFSFYNIYFFFLKIRIIFCIFTSKNSTLCSISNIYLNSNWLERETSEMYGLIFFNKNDFRRLLLDYSKNDNPLLKDFPLEGLNETFFNFFENQIIINQNEVIEL